MFVFICFTFLPKFSLHFRNREKTLPMFGETKCEPQKELYLHSVIFKMLLEAAKWLLVVELLPSFLMVPDKGNTNKQ